MHPASTAFPCQPREQWMNHIWKQMSSKLSSGHHLGASAAWGAVQPSEADSAYGRLKSGLTVNQKEAKAPVINQLYSTYSLNFPLTICCCRFHAHPATLKHPEVGGKPNILYVYDHTNVTWMLLNYLFKWAKQRRLLITFTLQCLVLFLSWETPRLCGCQLLCVYQDVALVCCCNPVSKWSTATKKRNKKKKNNPDDVAANSKTRPKTFTGENLALQDDIPSTEEFVTSDIFF